MASIMKREGKRVWIKTAYGEPAVARLKELGAHWDKDTKLWWIGVAKLDLLKEVLVAADEEVDQAQARGEYDGPPKPEDPHTIRLVAKVKYKGGTYFARFMGETKRGPAARLVTLDGSKDFWAKLDEVEVIKRYPPREVWDGRRYSGRTRTVYTTLGAIQDFIAKQKDPEHRRGRCTECDEWGPYGETCQECHEGTHL